MDTNEGQATPDRASPITDHPVFIVALILAFVLAAIVGAYLDWIWWPVMHGVAITVATNLILITGAVVAGSGRGLVRRTGLVILVVGIGVLAGQNLGPSRAELLVGDGTLALTLDSPVPASGSGGASCNTVADGTEISVGGDANMALDLPDEPFVSVWFEKGDRWQASGRAARSWTGRCSSSP